MTAKPSCRVWTDYGHYVVVGAVSLLLMFSNLAIRTLDSHEAFVAVTARAMLQPDYWLNPELSEGPLPENTPFNHWMVPVFNGMPRLVKTPLAYWCVAGLVKLGLPLNEFTIRLPSAIAAVLTAIITLALGRRLFSRRVALIGSLIFATAFGTYQWGRSARPEMLLCLWCTVTMACIYCGMHASDSWKRHIWLFGAWTAAGMGNLGKEFIPFFLALPVLLYVGWRSTLTEYPGGDRPLRLIVGCIIGILAGLFLTVLLQIAPALQWWRYFDAGDKVGQGLTLAVLIGAPLGWLLLRRGMRVQAKLFLPTMLPGAAIMFALFVPWLWYINTLFPQTGSVLSGQVLDRGLESRADESSWSGIAGLYYLLALSEITIPWTLLLPVSLLIPFLKRFGRERDQLLFLFCWVFGLVVMFSAAVGKRPHYILPALPAAALIMGYALDDLFFGSRFRPAAGSRRIIRISAFLFIIGIAAFALLVFPLPNPITPRWRHLLALSSAFILPLSAGAAALGKGRTAVSVTAVIVAAALGWFTFSAREDLWDGNMTHAVFARQAAEIVGTDAPVGGWGKLEEEVIYYFGRDIPDMVRKRKIMCDSPDEGKGCDEWSRWMKGPHAPEWLFAKSSREDELREMGFVPVLYSGPERSGESRLRMGLFRYGR